MLPNSIPNLSKLVEIGFCLPGTSTEIERIFSVIFNTLEAILNIKFNSEMTCAEFYKAFTQKECTRSVRFFLLCCLKNLESLAQLSLNTDLKMSEQLEF